MTSQDQAMVTTQVGPGHQVVADPVNVQPRYGP